MLHKHVKGMVFTEIADNSQQPVGTHALFPGAVRG